MAEVAASGSGEAGVELTLMGVSIGAALGGIGLAAFFFLARRAAAEAMAARFAPVHRLLLNKYYVDELYEAALVRPIMAVSRVVLWRGVDVGVIDRSVNGVAAIAGGLGAAIRRVQTGSVRSYAATLLVGAVLLVGYYLW
jgi:NADH-quinone oxidoreductase subunit L